MGAQAGPGKPPYLPSLIDLAPARNPWCLGESNQSVDYPMKQGTDTKSRLGVSVTDHFFSSHDWLFREQPLHDWGIDAHVEPKSEGRPTGQLLALQIKTGKSWFASKNAQGVRHAISDWHLQYWLRHQLPVFIVLHDPDQKLTIWQKVDRHLVERSEDHNWFIRVPMSNLLDEKSLAFFKANLANDPTSIRRSHLALDLPLMTAVKRADTAYLTILEMNHKGLSMRGAWLRFDDPHKMDADIVVERWHPERGIHNYMARMFPWLDYSHIQPLVDSLGMAEGEEHKLKVELNQIGRAFIDLERFYTEGPVPKDYQLSYQY